MTERTLLSLLRLCSPALPVGAFSYSRGLEYAVHAGWVHDEASALCFIEGALEHGVGRLDAPALYRFHRAFREADLEGAHQLAEFVMASRESRELLLEEQQMGQALARLLSDLGVQSAEPLRRDPRACFGMLFALAAVHFGIDEDRAVQGYLWTTTESQVGAAMRLLPLGQTAGQRMLGALIERIPTIAAAALALDDDELGGLTPGLAIASAWHETQYSRLFRS